MRVYFAPALVVVILSLIAIPAWPSINGSISGIVTDPSGGVVTGAQVVAIETQTQVRTEVTTDSKGFGLPITLSENDDNSLTGAVGVDVPQLSGTGSLVTNKNPRSGQPYFNPGYFMTEPLGQIGNANRRFFSGPGLNNWDMALLKNTNFTESKVLQLRFETFNTWNHAQFENPTGVINSSQFGVVTNARAARVMQVGAKFLF